MKKAIIIIVLIIGTLLLLYILFGSILSVKKTVKLSDIPKSTEYDYIYCANAASTGPPWAIKYFENSKAVKSELVFLDGNVPDKELKDHFFIHANNTFLLKGRFLEDREDPYAPGVYYKAFYVDNWDIVAPLNRDGNYFLVPNDKLYGFDFK